MQTKFLCGENILLAVRKANAQHVQRSLGVAYWGTGAVERLGLGEDLSYTMVICDLWSEACDSDTVIALLRGGAEVRHVEGFHAKTYLYQDQVIVGSANASRGGLGEPEGAAPKRTETALLSNDLAVLEEAREWFRIAWKKGTPIDFSTVEASRSEAAAKPEKPSLLYALAYESDLFAGLDLMLTFYKNIGASEEAYATWDTVKGEYGEDDRRAYERDDMVPFYEIPTEDAGASPPGRIYLDFTRRGKSSTTTGFGRSGPGVQSRWLEPKPSLSCSTNCRACADARVGALR